MNIRYAKVESDFLGVKIGRLTLEKGYNLSGLIEEIVRSQYDICKITIPSTSPQLMKELETLGLPYSINDVVFHYRADFMNMDKIAYENPDIQFEIYEDKIAHHELMQQMSMETFRQNFGAYFANPVFFNIISPQKKLTLFGEWATSFLPTKDQNRLAWFAKHKGEYIGFMAIQFTDKGCNPLIAGVLPKNRKKSYFIDLIRSVRNYCVEHQVEWTYAKSQAQNMASYRAYTRENMEMYQTTMTININSLFCYSTHPPISFDLIASQESISQQVEVYVKIVFLGVKKEHSFKKIVFKSLINSGFKRKYTAILTTGYSHKKESLYVVKIFSDTEKIIAIQYIYD